MTFTSKQKRLGWFILVMTVLVAQIFRFDVSRFLPGSVRLLGNTPEILTQAQAIGPVISVMKTRILIGLKLRKAEELDAIIAAMSNPSSPWFHKFLTPQEFLTRYGPTEPDVKKVVDFLTSKGLTVTEVSSNRLLVEVEGTLDQFEKAFDVKMMRYSLSSVSGGPAKDFIGNDRDPSVPGELAPIIESISGLNTLATLEPLNVRMLDATEKDPGGYTPQDVATVYNFPNKNNARYGTVYGGKGRTIALATVESFNPEDLRIFLQRYGIHRTGNISSHVVGKGLQKLGDETTLDIQMLASQAPDADIIVYMGEDPKFTTFAKVFNTIVVENKADVMSVSWGGCEPVVGASLMRTNSSIFTQAAAQGMAVFAAAGDDGAYDCKTKKPFYAVDYPTSDPHVTAVGGTTLKQSLGVRQAESAWTGSGGGESRLFDKPSWQKEGLLQKKSSRGVPDVALFGDPDPGYSIRYKGKWLAIAGTSAGAPTWAAYWSLVVEAAGHRLGGANLLLYRAGERNSASGAFTDITEGNNGHKVGPGYPALPGWDYATGWGVPDGRALSDWLLRHGASARSAFD